MIAKYDLIDNLNKYTMKRRYVKDIKIYEQIYHHHHTHRHTHTHITVHSA